jgi:hypothetical protein
MRPDLRNARRRQRYTLDNPTQALLQRSQFAAKELGDFLGAQGIVALAIETLEFAAARLAKQKSHGLFALRAERRGCVLGHGTLTLDQARAITDSLSPIIAEDGAVMSKV